MIIRQPNIGFLVAASAEGPTELNAFDHALLASGVGDTNLVRLSSILPPGCRLEQPRPLPPGALVPVAYGMASSSTAGDWIAASVAVAIPVDPSLPGLIMEHHRHGRLSDAESHVREMAAVGMAHRNREIRRIVSIGAEHRVERCGAVFAGVVLWHD